MSKYFDKHLLGYKIPENSSFLHNIDPLPKIKTKFIFTIAEDTEFIYVNLGDKKLRVTPQKFIEHLFVLGFEEVKDD